MFRRIALAVALLCAPAMASAQASFGSRTMATVGYLSADGKTTIPASAANPLPTTGSGGGGGAVTAASGSYSAGALSLGSIVDLGTGSSPGANTTNGIMKSVLSALGTPLQSGGSVVVTSAPTTAVTGTFWQATQPVSNASLPLPTGASTSALQTTTNTTLGSPFQAGGSIGNTSFGVTLTSATYGSTAALASNNVLKGSAGTLYDINVVADSTLYAAPWYVMVFDATSLPANGAITPAKCYQVGQGQPSFGATFPDRGAAMATGITIGVSTTGCFTQTASVHAFISGDFK